MNFFAKKQTEAPADAATPENVPVTDLNSDIVVHVMPQNFRSAHAKASDAKSTGLVILFGGLVFLAAIGYGFYYFMFQYKPAAQPSAAPAVSQTNSSPQVEPVQQTVATTTPIMPIATTTEATTTELTSSSSEVTINIPTPQNNPDQDNDGLTDEEEKILGTNSVLSDSDGDGYSDSAELQRGYNPAGAGKITDNPYIKTYTNKTYKYSLIYPAAWSVISNTSDSVMFSINPAYNPQNVDLASSTIEHNAFIQVNVLPNPEKLTLSDWYKKQFSLQAIDADKMFNHQDASGKIDWSAIKNPDGMTVFINDNKDNYIYTLNGNTGPDQASGSNYLNLFNSMVNSFSFIK